MEEMIVEAIEDTGAQGASLKEIIGYISCADIEYPEDQEQAVVNTLDKMVEDRKIISRRSRFFMIYHD
jgi:hypothetical protein